MKTRTRNLHLSELLREARWTGEELAVVVNRLGAESGLTLTYGRSAPSRWLSGTTPRPPTDQIIIEALSRRLGRTLNREDCGWPAPPDSATDTRRPGESEQARVPAQRVPASGSAPHRHAAYRLDTLQPPSWPPAHPGTWNRTAALDATRTDRDWVDFVELTLRTTSVLDATGGGGAARPYLETFLHTALIPVLHRSAGPARLRRSLFRTASSLAYLCAFTCYDEELHGRAQHYYTLAGELAIEADDPIGYAHALRGMSVQALSRGYRREAVHLAATALQAGSRSADPRTRAFLYCQLAHARSAAGEHRAAVADLAAAERLLERATSPPGPVGAFHHGALVLGRAHLAQACGKHTMATRELRAAVLLRPSIEHRSRAVIRVQLGRHLWALGRREEAWQAWEQLSADAAHVRSARLGTALRGVLALTRPQGRARDDADRHRRALADLARHCQGSRC